MHYFLRNYRMSAKIHHFSIRLHVLGQTTQAFMALHARRLCVNEWESRFFMPEHCQNTYYMKKCFSYKLLRIRFPTKKVTRLTYLSPQKWSWGALNIAKFEILQRIETVK